MVEENRGSIRGGRLLACAAGTASAQMWRGSGRIAGKVTDEANKPIEGVTVKLVPARLATAASR